MRKVLSAICFGILTIIGCKDNINDVNDSGKASQINYYYEGGLVKFVTLNLTDSTTYLKKSEMEYGTSKFRHFDTTIQSNSSVFQQFTSLVSLDKFWNLKNMYENNPSTPDGAYTIEIVKENGQKKAVRVEEGVMLNELESLRAKLDSLAKQIQ